MDHSFKRYFVKDFADSKLTIFIGSVASYSFSWLIAKLVVASQITQAWDTTPCQHHSFPAWGLSTA